MARTDFETAAESLMPPTNQRPSTPIIRQIEFELEKAEHGMAMLPDAERVMELPHAAEGSGAEAVGGA